MLAGLVRGGCSWLLEAGAAPAMASPPVVRSRGERPTPSPGEGALEACPEPSQASPKGVSGESGFLTVTQAGPRGRPLPQPKQAP